MLISCDVGFPADVEVTSSDRSPLSKPWLDSDMVSKCRLFGRSGCSECSECSDNTVRIWDVSQGVTLKELKGHTSFVNSVNFSPDGKTLASGSSDNTVRIWDVSQGVTLKELTGHTNSVRNVEFSSDGKTITSR